MIAIHSFKGGTGKSTICANLATLLALRGQRVGIVDCDLTAPGLHVLFEVPDEMVKGTVNDVIWGRRKLGESIIDLTGHLGLKEGNLLFMPASKRTEDIIKVINEGYDPILLTETFRTFVDAYRLDHLFLDTHPGISSDIMLVLVSCNPIILSLKYDEQDLRGSAIALEVIKRFGRHAEVLLNMVPAEVALAKAEREVKEILKHETISAIHFHPDVLLSGRKGGVFVLAHPDHPFSKSVKGLADRIQAFKP